MNDQQLLRYSRQILMPEIGIEGQQRLLDASALIVGLGGLGSPVALYLAAAGVGKLVLADDDHVDLANLQRQIIHDTADLGRPKVESAAQSIDALNPGCATTIIPERLAGARLDAAVTAVDVVVDCSDNFVTRFAINAACVKARKALVSGAVIRAEGQVAVFANRAPGDPCYRCLYPDAGGEETACSETGVLAPVAGLIGCIQATEVLKLITGFGAPLAARLLVVDARAMEWRTLKLRRDPACPVCGLSSA